MQKIVPSLWFNNKTEEAVDFYTSIFQNGKTGEIQRFGENMPGPEGGVMAATFFLAGTEFMAINGGPEFSFTPATSFFVSCQTEQELDALWNSLAEGGMVLMELEKYPFSDKFGWVNDRYGVSWQLSLTGEPQKITPFLLFVGAQAGRAEEAMQFYASLFQNTRIEHIQRHEPGGPEREGTVMHARFTLAGQEFMAMDSSLADHKFTFTPAVSFYVKCQTQAEVDHFWNKLTAGGEEQPCGWLVDRFGVSWQIVPDQLTQLMSDPDPVKANRVAQAMLKMQKIDIAQLQQAYAEA